MTEAEIIAMARRDLFGVAPGIWTLAADAEGEFVEARGEMGELLPVARIHPGASAAERAMMVNAPLYVRTLLGLYDRAVKTVRELRGGQMRGNPDAGAGDVKAAHDLKDRHGLRGKDYAAEAAMKCAEPAFRRFLAERHGLEPPLTEDRVAQKVRSLCGVTSRAELNNGAAAAERWKSLRADFDAWRRG
ncbi:MAG: hypothetical protein M9944_07945 [Rhizobiaceae bacterium]|nr:hypothetical protein [Rhizobiaceae bacterium]